MESVLTVEEVRKIIKIRVRDKNIIVAESIYFKDEYIRILPISRNNKNKGSSKKILTSFVDKTRNKLREIFPEDANMIHTACAHIRKRRDDMPKNKWEEDQRVLISGKDHPWYGKSGYFVRKFNTPVGEFIKVRLDNGEEVGVRETDLLNIEREK